MKILCPKCEIWLVELSMLAGQGEFYCERCSDLATRGVAGATHNWGRRVSDVPTCCFLCEPRSQ